MDSDNDEIVLRQKVYFSNERLDAQYPLRESSNGYNTEQAQKMRLKPKVKRLEFELPLNTESGVYDNEADEDRKVKCLKLSSSEIDTKSTFCASGFFHDQCLFLTPIEGLFHLRPDLGYLDPMEEINEKEKITKELTQLQVKVKKGETLAEQQRRENSYSFLAKKEQLEDWKPLTPLPSTSKVAGRVLDHLTMKTEKKIEMGISNDVLLSYIAPKFSTQEPVSKDPQIKEEVIVKDPLCEDRKLDLLTDALSGLFSNHGVVNLKDVRQCLRDYTQDVNVQDLAVVEDDVLHEWILKSKNVTCIRRVYMREAIGSAQSDPIRHIVMEIIRNQETIRRNDVISAAKAKGIRITEKQFESAMRELCISKDGGFWMLKTGIQ